LSRGEHNRDSHIPRVFLELELLDGRALIRVIFDESIILRRTSDIIAFVATLGRTVDWCESGRFLALGCRSTAAAFGSSRLTRSRNPITDGAEGTDDAAGKARDAVGAIFGLEILDDAFAELLTADDTLVLVYCVKEDMRRKETMLWVSENFRRT
jgi:hypothetical protein